MVGRREDDHRLAKLEIEIAKLADHVEEVDDHLRGVAGRNSLDTRVTLLEKEFEMHGVLLRRISDQFTSLHDMMDGMKHDLSTLKITKEVAKEVDQTKTDIFKEWLRFWGPIIVGVVGISAPLATVVFQNWEKITLSIRGDGYKPDQRFRRQIEADKKTERAKQVKKRLAELEKAATTYQP